MNKITIFISLFCLLLATSCKVVRPGEVAVKQKLGVIKDKVYTGGPVGYNPFVSKIIVVSTQTRNLEQNIVLPSKEGLSVTAQISILYNIDPTKIKQLITNYGLPYDNLVSSIFRSASADVCSKFYAKDMHSGMRASIEDSIRIKMDNILNKQGIIIESVLMKSIKLPEGLSNAIEQKLKAEQEAMRLEFVKQQAELAAEIKIIEAKATSDAQKILSEGLTEEILRLKAIEAFRELSQSQNAKVIITSGGTPFIINDK